MISASNFRTGIDEALAVKPQNILPLDPCHYKLSLLARVRSHETTHQSTDPSTSSVTHSSSQCICYSSIILPHGRSHTKAYSPVKGTEKVGNYSRVRSLNPGTKEIGNQMTQRFDGQSIYWPHYSVPLSGLLLLDGSRIYWIVPGSSQCYSVANQSIFRFCLRSQGESIFFSPTLCFSFHWSWHREVHGREKEPLTTGAVDRPTSRGSNFPHRPESWGNQQMNCVCIFVFCAHWKVPKHVHILNS